MSDELHLDRLNSFKKHTDLVVMKPVTGSLTLIARRLYSILLTFGQKEMNKRHLSNTELFSSPLSDLLSLGTSLTNQTTVAKKSFREMLNFKVDWESPDQSKGVQWKGITLLSEAEIDLVDGKLIARWAFPPTINKMLLDPSQYTNLNLKIMTSISSYHGTALYDICSRYRNNPSGVTCKQSVEWWQDALSPQPSSIGKRLVWRKYKHATLNAVIEEINEKTDISIKLLEFKEGRSTSHVQFEVKKKRFESIEKDDSPVNVAKIEEIEKAASIHGISTTKIDYIIRKYGEDLVMEKLRQLDIRLNETKLEVIKNKYAYLKTLLNNHEGTCEIETDDKIRPSSSLQSNVVALFENAKNPVQVKVPRVDPLNSEAVALEMANAKDEINKLDEILIREWIKKGLDCLSDRKLATPFDFKQSETPKIVSGQLGAMVVKLYINSKKKDDV